MAGQTFSAFIWDPHIPEDAPIALLRRSMQPATIDVSVETLAQMVKEGRDTYVVQAAINGNPLFAVRVVP